MAGDEPAGRVVINEDDHVYLAGVIAEKLVQLGCKVVLVTLESTVSCFSAYTLEQHRIQARLIELGVGVRCNQTLSHIASDCVTTACLCSGRVLQIESAATVLVTERRRNTTLYDQLQGRGWKTLELIGDAAARPQAGATATATLAGTLVHGWRKH